MTSDKPSFDAGDPMRDSSIRLQAIEAQSPKEVLNEEGHYKLPLPDQDREILERKLRKKRLTRFSILEVFLVTTAVAILLALSNVVSFGVYTVGLGTLALLMLIGMFDRHMVDRYKSIALGILLISYVLAAGVLLAGKQSWFD